ncbi:MAG: flagellar biosynthetic protein FliP [Pseudomonadota bacterium]
MRNSGTFQSSRGTRLGRLSALAPALLVAGIFAVILTGFFASATAFAADASMPSLSINLAQKDDPDSVVPAIKIVALLTVLSVAPAILLMMTSFTRILIVLSFVRQALGTMSMPPNQVLVGLSLFLTAFTMSPVIETLEQRAITPYLAKAITQEQALQAASEPLRKFMIGETRESDIGLFYSITRKEQPKSHKDIPLTVLVPAFMISELKTAFQIGFLIYIPFLVIDMVISAILMALGMMMLPPTIVSLPFKLVLFVLVDGWSLIVGSIVKSFHSFG